MSALGLILGATALAAQGGGNAATPQPDSLENASPVTHPATDVPGETADVVSGGAMDLDINEKKSELVLSYAWAARVQKVEIDDVTANVLQDAISIDLTLPLGGADNLLTREAFDGLADGPSLSLSWTSFRTRTSDPLDLKRNPRAAQITRDAAARCEAQVRAGQVEDYTIEECRLHKDRWERDFVRRFSGVSIPDLNRLVLSPVLGFGLEGTAGLNRFKYRTPLTLAENSDTKPQFSIKAYGILFPSDGVSMLTGSITYENGFEAQDDQILCRPVVADPKDDCVSAAPGAPTRTEKLPIELEYRRVFQPIPGLGRLAIAPRAAFDALSNNYELELPIYLTPAGTDRLLPGVTISYDSRHDEVTFGLFLRRSFKFGG